MPLLVYCLSSSDEQLLRYSAGALANLTACVEQTQASAEAAQAGAVPRLVQLLDGDEDARELAAFVLGTMAADLHEQPQAVPLKAAFVAAGGIPTTARLLGERGSANVHSAAAAIACLLATDDAACCADCVAAGMVPSLRRLAASESVEVRNHASAALQLLAVFSAEAAAAVREARLAPCLTPVLRPGDGGRHGRLSR